MQPPTTDPGDSARVALALSALAAGALLYMSALCTINDIAARTLAGPSARALASQFCARLPGCARATIESGFDWRRAQRTVVVRVKEQGGAELSRPRAIEQVGLRAAQAPGFLLRWVLRSKPVLLLGPAGAKARGGAMLPGEARR